MDMKLSQTRWVFGGFGRYKMSELIGLRAGLNYGRIQGDDKLSENPGRNGRNLNFRNDILELTARAEIYLLNVPDFGGTGRYAVNFKAFVFGGAGVYFSNPKGSIDNQTWEKLVPLNTEGIEYSKVGLVVPVGLGFFFTFKKRHRVGFDMAYNITFDDYLDDISGNYVTTAEFNQMSPLSQTYSNRRPELGNEDPSVPHENNYVNGSKRGDPTHNDTYLFANISYSYVPRGRSNFYRQKYPWFLGRKVTTRKSRTKF